MYKKDYENLSYLESVLQIIESNNTKVDRDAYLKYRKVLNQTRRNRTSRRIRR